MRVARPCLLGAVLIGSACGGPTAQQAVDAGADTTVDAGTADVLPERTSIDAAADTTVDVGAADAVNDGTPIDGGDDACSGMLCTGVCVDTQTDATNCGRCGHDCCGGQCSAGVCQPVSLSGVVEPYSLALQTPNLFWVSEASGGQVFRLPIGIGQTSSPLATTGVNASVPGGLAVNADSVFWLGSAGISSCLQTGCGGSPTVIAPGVPTGSGVSIAADANNVYFVESPGGVFQCPVTGCTGPPTSLAPGPPGPTGVAVDDANVYWVVVGTSSALEACTIGGCSASPVTLTTFPYLNGQIALAGASIFASAFDFEGGGVTGVIECAKTGCGNAPSVFYQYTSASGDFPTDIAADSTNVYWGGGNQTSPLLSCPVSGCVGAPTVLAPNWNGGSIALDSSCVYWMAYDPNDDNGAVMRVAKP